jgi:hypothetical protein
MLSLVSGGEVELRDEPQFIDMAILPCRLHIFDGWFLNPGGDPLPGLSPDGLFRLGEGVRSGCLCGMAAWLRRQDPEPAVDGDSLFTLLMRLRGRSNLNREPARLPLPGSVLLPDMGVAAARSGDFFVALTGGDRRGAFSHRDAGDIALYYRGKPVLVDCGLAGAEAHNVPAIEGVEQNAVRRAPEPPELQGDGYRMLTAGIAHAYPAAAKLYSWQRSLMMTPGENQVRLIDAFDFEGVKKRATVRFISPHEPVLKGNQAVLGPVALRFPKGLTPAVSEIPMEEPRLKALWGEKLYRLELAQSESAPGARLDFTFSPV